MDATIVDIISLMDETVRVLLLEDDELLAETIVETLAPACRVVRAGSTEHARRLLAGEPFDVLISDYWLGYETSEDFLGEVAAAYPGLRRLLFSSLADDVGGALHARGLIDAAVQKPFSVARLLAAIRA
jgi:DNA-binding NtrC family response regulator